MKSNLHVLVANKTQETGKRISLRGLARDLEISTYTIYALANNELEEFPRGVIEKLCNYFGCEVGDLLVMREEKKVA